MNDYFRNTKLKIINGQIIALFIFIVTLFVSVVLAYNEKLNLEGKQSLFDDEDVIKIAIINRIIVVSLGLYFVYTTYIEKNLDNKDNIPLISSTLALLASIIGLYDLFRYYQEQNDNINNIDLTIL